MNYDIFKIMDEYPPLSHEELIKSDVEKVILHNLRFAYTLAKRAAEKYPGLSEDEIIEGMLLGATEAANRWDPEKSKITSYMGQWVPLVIKGIANENKHVIGRNTMHIWKSYKIDEFVSEFKLKYDKNPSKEEIAEGTGFSETTVYNIHNLGIKSVISLSGNQDDNKNDCDLNNVIADHDVKSPFEELSEMDISMIIERLIDGLDLIEKEIVNRRFFCNHKYKEISDDLNLPYPKVKHLEQQALNTIRRELKAIETA